MFTPPSESTVDKIIENASKYNRGRQVRILLDAALAFDRTDNQTREEIDKFKELFYSLIEQTPVADKRQIAIILARNVYTPRAIALYLAMEDVATASPVLLYSPLISEVDIVTIANKCDVLALRVLARRNALSESAVRAIVARRDTSSVKILRQNPSVTNSDSVRLLPQEKTSDLPLSVDPVSDKTSKRRSKTASKTEKEILALAARGGKIPQTTRNVTGIYTDTSGASGTLLKAARTRNKISFFNELSAQLGLGPAHLKKFIMEDPENSLCAALKALEVPTGVASQIMLLMDPEIGASIQKLRLFMKGFNSLDSESCKVKFLKAGSTLKSTRSSRSISPRETITTAHSKSVESQLAAALRERRQALTSEEAQPTFGRRHRAA